MRKIQECFDKQLAEIYKKLLAVDGLNQLVKQFLPASLQPHCQVTHFNQGRMNIGITEVALATELRFFLPTLRDLLRQKAGLYQLTALNISIIAPLTPIQHKNSTKKPLSLSKTAREAVLEASKMGDCEALKTAFRKLGQHASSGSSSKG